MAGRPRSSNDGKQSSGLESHEPNPRAHAILERAKVVEGIEAAGVSLTRRSEAVFETPSGSRVALPFSAELEPGKWWLGSYEGRFDEVLLLCESGQDGLLIFHLDPDWIEENIVRLSRDSKGNVKFNVDRVGARFCLRMGRGRSLELTPFIPSRDAPRLRR